MLSLTTKRHRLFFTIPGLSGSSDSDFSGYGVLVDNAVDALHAKCTQDAQLVEQLGAVTSRQDAYQVIAKHLRAVTPDAKWLRDCAGSDLCRRVLYLMHPDRFGFQSFGWIH